MPGLILPGRINRQPAQLGPLERSGIGSKLVLVSLPALSLRNLAGGAAATVIGTAPTGNQVSNDQYGRELMIHPGGGADGYGGLRFGAETIGTSSDWTMVWVGQPQNCSTSNGVLMSRGADGSGAGWNASLGYESGPISGAGTGSIVARVIDSSPAGFSATISGLTLTTDDHQRVALSKRGSVVTVYDWRTRQLATASAGNGGMRTSTVGIGLGLTTTNATATAGHNKVNIALAAAVGASHAEVWALLDNPYSVFEAPPRRLWAMSAVGGDATATPPGVGATASVGAVAASGGAVAAPAGVGASATAGTAVARGGAIASPAGVFASAEVGAVSPTGGARAAPAGAAATASAGVVAASGAGTASPSGMAATASVGAVAARGGATAAPAGVFATASSGQVVPSAGGAGIAMPAGVGASTLVGTVSASGGARAAPVGVVAYASVGILTFLPDEGQGGPPLRVPVSRIVHFNATERNVRFDATTRVVRFGGKNRIVRF